MGTQNIFCLLEHCAFKGKARGGSNLLAIGSYDYCERFLYNEIRDNHFKITGEFQGSQGTVLFVDAESIQAFWTYEIQNMRDVAIEE